MQIISFAANPTFNLCKSKILDKTMDLFMKLLLNQFFSRLIPENGFIMKIMKIKY